VFTRQHNIQQILASGKTEEMQEKASQLEKLTTTINDEIATTAEGLEEMVRQSEEARLKLVEMKHVVSNEAGMLRDRVLTLIHHVELEDTRMAWLRKEQLQLLELHGLICHSLLSPQEQDPTQSSSDQWQSRFVTSSAS